MKEIIDELKKPFPPDQVKWKVQATKGKWSTFVPYVDARAVVDRLNDATGGYWQDQYSEVSGLLLCKIGIYDASTGQWLWRQDTGTESREDKEKGHVSDAFKRASVKWGLGHDLYNTMPIIKVKNGQLNGKPTPLGFDGKQIYNATDFCKKLLTQNKGKSTIWFDHAKAGGNDFTQTTPPPEKVTPPPAPKSNAGEKAAKYKKLILGALEVGSDKQKDVLARMLSSSAFSREDRKSFIDTWNATTDQVGRSEVMESIQNKLKQK